MNNKEIEEKIKQFNFAFKDLDSLESLNGERLFITWGHKKVFQGEDRIYRIDFPPDTFRRMLIYELANKLGCYNFGKETICKDLSTPFWTVTTQDIVEPIEIEQDKQIFNYLKSYEIRPFEQLVEKTGIFGFNHKNIGLDKDKKLIIYDYLPSGVAVQDYDNPNKWTLHCFEKELISKEF